MLQHMLLLFIFKQTSLYLQQSLNSIMNSLACIRCSRPPHDDDCIFLQCDHILCYLCGHQLLFQHQNTPHYDYQCLCGQISPFDPDVIEILRKLPSPQKQESREIEINEVKCLYCFDCNSECFSIEQYLSGMHKTHDVKYIRKAYEQLESSTSQLVSKIKEMSAKLQGCNNVLQSKKMELRQIGQSQKNRIRASFNHLRSVITNKQKQLCQEVEKYYQKECVISIQKMMIAVDKKLNSLDQYLQEIQKEVLSEQSNYVRGFDYYNTNKARIEEYLKQIQIDSLTKCNIRKSFFNIQDHSISKVVKNIESIRFGTDQQQINTNQILKPEPKTCRQFTKKSDGVEQDLPYTQYFRKAKQEIMNRSNQIDLVLKTKDSHPIFNEDSSRPLQIPNSIKANLLKYNIKSKVKLGEKLVAQDTENQARSQAKQRISRIQSMFYDCIERKETKRRPTLLQ